MDKIAVCPTAMEKPSRFNLGVIYGNLVFTAGITGSNPATNKIVDGGIGPQTRQTLENIQAILEEAGSSLQHAIRVDAFLADIDDFSGYNEAYDTFFANVPVQPVRATLVVDRFKGGAIVEIAVIAALPD